MDEQQRKEKVQVLVNSLNLELANYKKAYTKIRELLHEIEQLGGYTALGYRSLKQFHEKQFVQDGIKYQWIRNQNATKDIEIVIGVPLGTYHYADFEGIKLQLSTAKTLKGVAIGYCDITPNEEGLNKGQQLISLWQQICELSGTDRPTGEQIHKYGCQLRQKFVKRSHGVNSKIEELTKELEEREEEIAKLYKENAMLKATIKQMRSMRLTA